MANIIKRRREKLRAGGGLNAHKLVAEVAIEMANELFDVYAKENDVYRAMRQRGEVTEKQARKTFVERVAPRLFEDARASLVACLAEPDDRVTPGMKETIYEALLLDNDLRGKRTVASDVATVPAHLH